MTDPATPTPQPSSSEPDPRTCLTCGGAIPADAPDVGGGAACPRCLLGAGIPTGGFAPGRRPLDPPNAAEVAALFPDYEILGLLGRGGMGVVWKARQRALDRVVALKVLPRDVASETGFSDRFQREARALARLAHPNVVGVHEFGERGGMYFLVLEFVEGVNIRQALRDGRISTRDALRIVPQICDALQYAHEHGVVHRDIKPENVLIDRDGRVKVADFGLAKIVAAPGAAQELTVTGQLMGTPHYMAPEQWERPTTVDHRADIYSLGVVFYEMLTGELPLGRFQPPSHMVRMDVRIDEVVLRSLEKAPERRWQRAADVKSEVGAIQATPGGATISRSGPSAHDAVVPPPVRSDDLASSPMPRTSRLAVAASVATPAAVLLAVAVAIVGRAWNASISVGVAVIGAVALALAGSVAGAIAWRRISQSGGRLRGAPYAIVGTFLPWVVTCVATPISYLLVSRQQTIYRASANARLQDLGRAIPAPQSPGAGYVSHGSAAEPPRPAPTDPALKVPRSSPRGSPLTEPRAAAPAATTAAVAPRGVQRAFRDLVALAPQFAAESAFALYAPADRAELARLDAATLRRRGRAGELGLPLLFADRPAANLGSLRLTPDEPVTTDGVEFHKATDGTSVFTFGVTRDGNRAHFVSRRVEMRLLGPSDADFDRSRGALEHRMATEQVRELWDDLIAATRAVDLVAEAREVGVIAATRGDVFEAVGDLYSPATRDELAALAPPVRAERGRRLQLGLPLVPAASLADPLSAFRIIWVDLDTGSRTAVVTAQNASRSQTIRFPITCRGVARWYFAAESVHLGVAAPPEVVPFPDSEFTVADQHAIVAAFERCAKGVRGDEFAELLGLYLPEERATLRVLDLADLRRISAENDTDGDLGLPFWALGRGKESLDGFRVNSVKLSELKGAPPRRLFHVVAWATDGKRSLRFELRGRLIEASGAPSAEWYFHRGPVLESQGAR